MSKWRRFDVITTSLLRNVFAGMVRMWSLSQCKTTCHMMTSSNGNIFRVTGPLCGEFTGPGEFPTQRPVTRSFDVFFDLRLNKRLNKQSWGWWFETLSRPFWRHRNEMSIFSSILWEKLAENTPPFTNQPCQLIKCSTKSYNEANNLDWRR